MRRLLLASLAFGLCLARVLVFSAPARADGREAEERHAYAEALAAYDHEPGGAARAAWLRARSEGSFEPLAALEKARRSPDPDLEGLLATAESWPAGLVRVEARVFAGDAYMRRGRPEEAIALWRGAARDPAADPALAHAAIASAVRAHLANDAIDEARIDLQWFYDDRAAADIARAARRRNMHFACILVLALVGGLIARALVRTQRRGRGFGLGSPVGRGLGRELGLGSPLERERGLGLGSPLERERERELGLGRMLPLTRGLGRELGLTRSSIQTVLAYSAFVSLAGLGLSWAYSGATATPFLWFGVALVPLLLGARAWAAAGGAPRSVRAAACAAAVVAAAFLVLEQTGQLEGLGL